MLIDIRIKNFLSFKELHTFTLLKSKNKERTENSFVITSEKEFSLLKTAAIYGPNSSGKSNLLKAMQTMKNIVIKSRQHGDLLPLIPFILDEDTVNQPTEFEVSFIVDNIRYQYGFSASSLQIFDEWLFAFPAGRPQKWFERVWDEESGKHLWKFSQFLSGTKKLWQQSTRDNALFLSTAVQLNSEQLKPIFDWFNQTLRFVGTEGLSSDSTAWRSNELITIEMNISTLSNTSLIFSSVILLKSIFLKSSATFSFSELIDFDSIVDASNISSCSLKILTLLKIFSTSSRY